MSTAAQLPRTDSCTTFGIVPRVRALDWAGAAAHLDRHGWASFERLLRADECAALSGLYDDDTRFRSRVVMARHGFGRGEYKYFAYPLPQTVADLRTALYLHLAPIANRWNESMKLDVRYPAAHADFVARCHRAGQTRPTPLLLRYRADDYNCLHQDLLRRTRLSAPGRHPALGTGAGLHRRRVRAHRTTATDAVARRGRAAAPGRRRGLRGAPPPGGRGRGEPIASTCATA